MKKNFCLVFLICIFSITISDVSIDADVSGNENNAQRFYTTYSEVASPFGDVDWFYYSRNFYEPYTNLHYDFYTTGSNINLIGFEKHNIAGGEKNTSYDYDSGSNFLLANDYALSQLYPKDLVKVTNPSYYTGTSYSINIRKHYDKYYADKSVIWIPVIEHAANHATNDLKIKSILYLNADDSSQYMMLNQMYNSPGIANLLGISDAGNTIVSIIPVVGSAYTVTTSFADSFSNLEQSTHQYGYMLEADYLSPCTLSYGVCTSQNDNEGLKIVTYEDKLSEISAYNPHDIKYGINGAKGKWVDVDVSSLIN